MAEERVIPYGRGRNRIWPDLLTASSEAKRTCPGTMARTAFPVWDWTKGAITDPVATPTPSSIALLIFSVILDSFLTLRHTQQQSNHNFL